MGKEQPEGVFNKILHLLFFWLGLLQAIFFFKGYWEWACFPDFFLSLSWYIVMVLILVY